MKKELKDKLLASLKLENVKDIIESKEFYFQKAIDKYNEFINLPKLGEEITNNIIKEVKKSKSFNYINFLNQFKEDTIEYRVIFCMSNIACSLRFQSL